jgi:sugar lactone lactonase YvrE
MKAEQFTAPVTFHGEGAVWHPGWGGLRLVDMFTGDVLAVDDHGDTTRLPTGSPVAAMIRPRESGGWVIATEREFTLWNERGEKEWTSETLTPEGVRLNEGGCAPDGTLLCGSMAYDQAENAASVVRLDTARRIRPLFGGVTISNGLGFTGNGERMYYADTPTGRVDVFDVQTPQTNATPVDRRTFVTIPEEHGSPDGLWVDEEDGIWVALYGGAAVHHYDESGHLQEKIELPTSNVTSCTFGGEDGRTLFITTSRENLPAGAEPQAGAVFRADVGVKGRPVLSYRG